MLVTWMGKVLMMFWMLVGIMSIFVIIVCVVVFFLWRSVYQLEKDKTQLEEEVAEIKMYLVID